MGPSYTNPLGSEEPNNSNNWLSPERLKGIALEFLYETRPKQKLEYLYNQYSQANGLEMFEIMCNVLDGCQSIIDSIFAQRGPVGEGDENGENIHWITLDESREREKFPFATFSPQHFGMSLPHIGWNDLENAKVFINSFIKLKAIELKINDVKSQMSGQIQSKLGLSHSDIKTQMDIALGLIAKSEENKSENNESVGKAKKQSSFNSDINKSLDGVVVERAQEQFKKIEERLFEQGWLDSNRNWKNAATSKYDLVELIATLKVNGFFREEFSVKKGRQNLGRFFSNRYSISIPQDYMRKVEHNNTRVYEGWVEKLSKNKDSSQFSFLIHTL
ncbi:hypothetical protein [Siphonobacter sp. SORGH_AS_0500]|uniref:hypothetical protein n=1 Tax=Siphonobacter sp. SORGH_AS_0500 TaxID=1864824 RepID=UPI00285EFA34|nr:hypothetical protein [Siphonobacter sp. SORGH_AS_0500]MDR6194938.1 hypothetical protein [Siphonobacter sp. SORGH_AS_0500]